MPRKSIYEDHWVFGTIFAGVGLGLLRAPIPEFLPTLATPLVRICGTLLVIIGLMTATRLKISAE